MAVITGFIKMHCLLSLLAALEEASTLYHGNKKANRLRGWLCTISLSKTEYRQVTLYCVVKNNNQS